MTIYENTHSTAAAGYTGENFGYLYGGSRTAQNNWSYREGTRRRKPEILGDTDYQRREDKWRHPKGSFRKTLPGYAGHYGEIGQLDLSANVVIEARQWTESYDVNLENMARQRALLKLDRKDMDFGTALAESPKVARMLGDLGLMSLKALVAVQKKDWRELVKVTKQSQPQIRKGVVDAYLTYQYGVKPLMQDISGATAALTRLPREAFKVEVRASQGKDSFVTRNVGMGTDHKYVARSNYEESVRVKIQAIPRPITSNEDLRWALGLDNFGLTQAWELTPFSFVLDWMLPIGEYIRALTTMKYYSGWEVCVSRRVKENIMFSGYTGKTPDGWNYSCEADGSVDMFRLLRNVSLGPPMYGLPYKDPRSIDHMAKALALLASVLSSKGNPSRTLRI